MNFNAAIKLLAPFHAANLVAAYATESGIQGQLSTGVPEQPFIPINDSQVCADDVFAILEAYDEANNHHTEYQPIPFYNAPTSTPETCWGLAVA